MVTYGANTEEQRSMFAWADSTVPQSSRADDYAGVAGEQRQADNGRSPWPNNAKIHPEVANDASPSNNEVAWRSVPYGFNSPPEGLLLAKVEDTVEHQKWTSREAALRTALASQRRWFCLVLVSSLANSLASRAPFQSTLHAVLFCYPAMPAKDRVLCPTRFALS